ncbi:MAG: hypothetical protein Q8K63_02075, partial [Acidimicrobiales bacterium]|nr:hypothetical protein [Acidimicrobiales bacterium]
GTPTVSGPGTFARHYLQFFQCWGEDDGTNAENPGPPPEQCAQGAANGVFGGRPESTFPSGSQTTSRIISNERWSGYNPNVGVKDERTKHMWLPFRAVNGTEVPIQVDSSFTPEAGGAYWLNPFFNIITTNEIAGAKTQANGTGAELFEVHTGLENSGLGCGQSVQPVAGGTKKQPKCWLVAVPRGAPTDENVGHPSEGAPDQSGVATSPLSERAWKNRIAIPLEFNSVDAACALGDDQRRLVGSELVTPAISSWQPVLCGKPGRSPYAFAPVAESTARTQLLQGGAGAAGMVVVSRPVDASNVDPESPVVYAPVALSGVVIGFNIERINDAEADAEAKKLSGLRIKNLNLTPRLLAKLLTQSYREQVVIKSDPKYPWLEKNAAHLAADKDFLRFNPEFDEMLNGGRNLSGLLLTGGSSDVATQVWEYVLADPEAKAWLDGTADEWGMQVNPVYRTKAVDGQAPPFGDPTPQVFPKAEPYCHQAEKLSNGVTPPPLCGTDWLPYVQALRDGARLARIADDGARIDEDPFAASADKYYRRGLPQPLGRRSFLTLTDSASAFQYGLQTASLSRAGDNGDGRRFVGPNEESLTAAVAGMEPRAELGVLEPKPLAAAPGGYPLAALSYAAIKPLDLDATSRSDYADFVEYAAGDGQVAGLRVGQLPIGYAPLPASLKTQSVAAAKTIRELKPGEEVVVPNVETARESDSGPSGGGALPFSSGSNNNFASALDPSDPATMTTPLATSNDGGPADRVKRFITPAVAVAATRFALPGLTVLAMLSALGALEITKRRRDDVS